MFKRNSIALGIILLISLLLIVLVFFFLETKEIDKERAKEIALDRLRTSVNWREVDFNRITITFNDQTKEYKVDFAVKSADDIAPGLWTEGCYVLVDARLGA